MKNDSLLGPWIRRFLLEHLVAERNLSRNTQRSYRDTLCLLLPRLALQSRTTVRCSGGRGFIRRRSAELPCGHRRRAWLQRCNSEPEAVSNTRTCTFYRRTQP